MTTTQDNNQEAREGGENKPSDEQVANAVRAFINAGKRGSDMFGAMQAALTEVAVTSAPAPTDTGASGAGEDEVLALHRQLAAEKLRADQGWQRYESKNRECLDLRAQLARQHQDSKPTDLSRRLREAVASETVQPVPYLNDLMRQAADEIERLAAAQGEPSLSFVEVWAAIDGNPDHIPQHKPDLLFVLKTLAEASDECAEKHGAAQAVPGDEVRDALLFAADTIELFDDATMRADYMLDAGECAAVIRALPDYLALRATNTKGEE